MTLELYHYNKNVCYYVFIGLIGKSGKKYRLQFFFVTHFFLKLQLIPNLEIRVCSCKNEIMLSNDFLENNRSSRRCRGNVPLCFASINIPGDVAFVSDKTISICHSAASFIFLLQYYLQCKNRM